MPRVGLRSTAPPAPPRPFAAAALISTTMKNGRTWSRPTTGATASRSRRRCPGKSMPYTYDMSPLGGSHKFTFCVAENQDKSPYSSIHTDFGFKQDDNAVTVFGCVAPYPAVVNGTAKRMLNTLCEGFASTTIPMYHG